MGVWSSPDSWKIQDEFNLNRFKVEAAFSYDVMRKRLKRGFEIWEKALDRYPAGFRPGYGSFCRTLYRVLEDLGIHWCSVRMASPTAMQWSRGAEYYAIPERIYPHGFKPFKVGRVVEYPFAGDYGYHIPPDAIPRFVELGWRQFQAALAQQAPFIMLGHHHGLACTGNPDSWKNSGYRSQEQLLQRILESRRADFLTLSELHARWAVS